MSSKKISNIEFYQKYIYLYFGLIAKNDYFEVDIIDFIPVIIIIIIIREEEEEEDWWVDIASSSPVSL